MYDRACCPSSLFSSHRRCVSCPGAIGCNSSINVGRVVHDEEEQVSNKFHEQDDSSDTTNNAIEILRTDQQVVRDDNILNEEVNNLGSVVQSGDEDGGDATSLPSSPMDADIGMNDNDDNNDDNSNNNVNMNNIKKRTSPRLERRRNKHPAPPPPPPPGIDYITIPYGTTEHDNHYHHRHPSIIIDEEISTIYGGVWNSGALLAGGRRLKDMMGCLEEGYAIHSSECVFLDADGDNNIYSTSFSSSSSVFSLEISNLFDCCLSSYLLS